ncbi:hypothetical protein C5N14_11105 [Micromonospora sp. MW-13]|uniref:hypothetical protein n=1 Tax=Micromonospora sp. MW-13 TaxID=2094022 RepID=UPI000E4515D6|nr:hypothetical protein [Micromonospora sp. MW-13]RGC68836.1 hypothetical protein C5N14_11105 [Micromonospora sp. MW-13]
MTSEGPHHPGQEPDEVSPGTGAPAPYGVANPDLGWAPPPPTARPSPPAPGWTAQNDQPATAAWGAAAPPNAQPPTAAWGAAPQGDQPPTAAWGAAPQNDQPPTAAWGAAQVPAQQPEPARPDAWGPPAATPQPAWGQADQPTPGWRQEEQPGPAWAATAPPTPPGSAGGPPQPAWGPQPEQPAPAWADQAEQPPAAWGQSESAARGAARVPGQATPPPDAWPAQDDANGWNPTGQPDDQPAQPGGWNAGGQPDDPARSGGWNTGSPSAQQDDPARSGGWNTRQQDDEPAHPDGWAPAEQVAYAGKAEQPPAAWGQAESAARGAARVPGQATPPPDAWPAQDDANGWNPTGQQDDEAGRSGWNAGGQPDDPARSGGWNTGSPSAQQDDPARSGGLNVGGRQDDPARSDGWAATEGKPDDQSQPPAWAGADGPAQPGAWGAASVPQQQEEDRPAVPDWAAAEPTSVPPARATATVGVDGPPSWGTPAENQQQWPAPDRTERPAVPDVEPWAPGEAWGRSAEAEPAAPQPAGNGWESERSEDRPLYQPAPAPGISPANAVPLPPQEQRVPGASLAAAPPTQFPPQVQPAVEPAGREGGPPAYEPEPAGADNGWGRVEEPQSPAGPVVPAPRLSPEGQASARAAVSLPETGEPAAGSISASASVPLASRVMPPPDQALLPGGAPAPQPRVYGRPTRPEPAEEPEQAEQHGFHPDPNPPHRFEEPGPQGRFDEPGQQGRFDEPGPQSRFDEPGPPQRFDDRGPQRFDEPDGQHGYGDRPAAAAAAVPPTFPPGVPSFVDPSASNRPVNGVRPHDGDRPGDQFGGPATQVSGGTAVQGHGPAPFGEPAQGGFPPQGQQSGSSWDAESEQGRFDAFKPDAAEQKTEAPVPKVRNGRVLAVVLVAAVLILAVPLGLLMLLGKVGGGKTPAFDPAVGSCVKQVGGNATSATCGDAGVFTVVSKVDAKEKCADPAQPYVMLQGDVPNKVLCLKPSTK